MARHAIIAAAALLLSGCITFPEELLLADGNKGDVTGEARRETSSPDLDGSVDATRDGIADVPRPDTLSDGLDADGAPPDASDGPPPDVTAEGAPRDSTVDGPSQDMTADGPVPDSTRDTTPLDSTVDTAPPVCATYSNWSCTSGLPTSTSECVQQLKRIRCTGVAIGYDCACSRNGGQSYSDCTPKNYTAGSGCLAAQQAFNGGCCNP